LEDLLVRDIIYVTDIIWVTSLTLIAKLVSTQCRVEPSVMRMLRTAPVSCKLQFL